MPNEQLDRKTTKKYLEGAVKQWRGHRDKAEVTPKFIEAWEALPSQQKFAFMAMFYVDAFQSVHSSIFAELIPEEE